MLNDTILDEYRQNKFKLKLGVFSLFLTDNIFFILLSFSFALYIQSNYFLSGTSYVSYILELLPTLGILLIISFVYTGFHYNSLRIQHRNILSTLRTCLAYTSMGSNSDTTVDDIFNYYTSIELDVLKFDSDYSLRKISDLNKCLSDLHNYFPADRISRVKESRLYEEMIVLLSDNLFLYKRLVKDRLLPYIVYFSILIIWGVLAFLF